MDDYVGSKIEDIKAPFISGTEEAKTILIEQVEEVLLSEEPKTSELATETSATMGDDTFDIFDSPMRNTEDTEAEKRIMKTF